MRAYGREELAEQATLLASHSYCQDPADIARAALLRLMPKESMTTLEYAETKRVFRKPDGTKTHWSRDLTPYMVPIMDALDNPDIPEVIVPKPGRCGGTVGAENHALKRLENGPAGDIGWYLAGPTEVRSYADRVLAPMFEDHEAIGSQLPRAGSKGNTATFKRVGSQVFELLVMSGSTTTNRQFAFIVLDEPDSYSRNFRSNFLEQARNRQLMLGNDRKIYACAHPDVGWSGGIAAAWALSTQGIFVMKCPECGGHGSPYPTKFWPEVPRFRLVYDKSPEGTPLNARLAKAEASAGIGCPHCGVVLDEVQRGQMIEEGSYMHKGQELDIEAGILGEPDKNKTWGFWIHVLMSKQVGLGDLAKALEGAIEHKERTGKSDKLKQVMIRMFGEAFEGAGNAEGLDARALRDRTKKVANVEVSSGMVNYSMGEVPDGVLFATAQVDTGGSKFDVMITGWDLERRRYILDRFTLKQRLHSDGVWRDLAPTKVQDDWDILIKQVIDRKLPLQRDRTKFLPVALTVIDIKDGNATPFGVEFLRRVSNKRWGAWQKVRGIMGARSATAPEVAPSVKDYNVDNDGKKIEPPVIVHNVGSWKLKEDVVETLAISDGSPGQWYFPLNFPDSAYEEFFNETLQDKEWVRNGPNESLDLGGYGEAARQIIQPDRPGIIWDDEAKRPIWARPVRSEPVEPQDQESSAPASQPAPKQQKRTVLDRFSALNRGN